jgi:hypothetical protein
MRTSFRKLKLAGAIAVAMGVAGVTNTADANVSLAVDGLGDAIMIQYFNVDHGSADKNTWQSMFRIFNNSDDAVAVKVRFREADESREILDFIIWLSPYDAWSGWTDPNAANSANAVPGVRSDDMSCTTPAPRQGSLQTETFGWLNNEVGGTRYAQFKASAIAGAVDTQAARAANTRLREGHIEIIGMARFARGTDVFAAVEHHTVAGNRVPTCAGLENFAFGRDPNSTVGERATGQDVGNVLAANAFLMRLSTGQAVGFEPVVFANFAQTDATAQAMLLETITDAQKPDFDSGGVMSDVSDVDTLNTQVIYSDAWNGALPAGGTPRKTGNGNNVTGSIDAVSATLTRTAILNEWMRRPPTVGGVFANTFSQWVVTFPTMHYYLDNNGVGGFVSPFAYPTLSPIRTATNGVPRANWAPFTAGGQGYTLDIWNTEEEANTYTSPIPGGDPGLVGEVNVISWGDSTDPANGWDLGLHSNNPTIITDNLLPPAPRFDPVQPNARLGWARLEFDDPHALTGLVGTYRSYFGLPVTGFGFTVYQTSAGSVDGNVAMAYPHKYERDSAARAVK